MPVLGLPHFLPRPRASITAVPEWLISEGPFDVRGEYIPIQGSQKNMQAISRRFRPGMT